MNPVSSFVKMVLSFVGLAGNKNKKNNEIKMALATLQLMLIADVAYWLYYESAVFAVKAAKKN